jgi:hypothetical protein
MSELDVHFGEASPAAPAAPFLANLMFSKAAVHAATKHGNRGVGEGLAGDGRREGTLCRERRS